MTKGRRAAALLLLVAALVLATLGQFYFFRRPEYLWDGAVLYGLAILCFVLAWRQATSYRRPRREIHLPSLGLGTWMQDRPIPAGLLALGLVLSLTATLLSKGRLWNQSTTDVVVLWMLGASAVVLAALWPTSWPAHLPQDYKSLLQAICQQGLGLRNLDRAAWLEMATVASLTLLALTLRLASLADVPYTVGGDEAWHGLLARQVLQGELRNPFVMGYMSMPTFFYWPLSWSLWLVGDNVMALRLPAALAGTVTVPALYLFTRRLWGRRVALLAALFLAGYDYHLHYSRLGANNVWDALFVLLTFWALDWGLAARKEVIQVRAFLLAGVVMGLSVYFYTGARLLPLLVVIYLGFLGVRRHVRRLRGESKDELAGLRWRWLVLMVLAFLVVAGPMLSYALSHPNEWNARLNQVGIIQSGWLAHEPGLTGKSTLRILAEQFLRAAGAFHVFPDRTFWYGAERPLLGFLAGIFAMLGMVWAVTHWRERRHFLVLIWFWSVVISGGMLTESPPSSQRLVIAIPAVALLVAFGLEQTVRLAQRFLGVHRRWENVALGLLALALVVSSVRFYFVEYTPARRYGSANGETATMIGHYLQDLDRGVEAYFFGAPRIYWSFGTMSFLAPGVQGRDVVEPLAGPTDFGSDDQSTVFIFLPERAGELTWVEQSLPGGRVREFRDASGELRFTVYELDR
jgi:4-amino-4-deoxy-L-arabinose transferase-like glycosyltransferase